MSEFEKSLVMVKNVLRVQFVGGAALIAGFATYHGVVNSAWTGAAMFAGGGMAGLSALMWLMKLRTEALLKKVTAD